ncbi:MAG: diguanylate cyclase [Calditrichaeota bacterium]|nr:MAG: diguanylate cyclase [Calditrichota bacterium]
MKFLLKSFRFCLAFKNIKVLNLKHRFINRKPNVNKRIGPIGMTHSQHHHPARILVVDDEIGMQKLLKKVLEQQKFHVEGLLDSRQIAEKIESFRPDLLIMDIMMPELDGISATRRVRNLKLSSYLPIIVVTARKETHDLVAALEAGADDYITKPFEFEELLARVRNMLRLKKLHDRLMTKTMELDEANQQISRLNHVLVETNKQLQRKVYNFHNLFEVSFRVMGQLELGKLINQALLNILGIFTSQSAALLLNSEEEPDLFEVVEAKGLGADESIYDLRIYRHEKLIHYLELTKKPFQIREVSREFKEIVPQLKKHHIEVVSPVFQKEEVVGVLLLGPNVRGEEYSEDELEMLAVLTNMMAVAIHNAQLFEHVRALSYTDGMTGLHNYRFFRLRLKEEVARARRENSPVSLLISDVDYFKNYNDTLGHPAGDEVLRKVSRILQTSVRDNDIVARYGGEEFAIVLPGTDSEGAYALAERIRLKVEEEAFYKEEIQPNKKLTISIGIGNFPVDAVTVDDLIIEADRALYHAKHSGRNVVVRASEIAKA